MTWSNKSIFTGMSSDGSTAVEPMPCGQEVMDLSPDVFFFLVSLVQVSSRDVAAVACGETSFTFAV